MNYVFKPNKYSIWYQRLVSFALSQSRIKSDTVYYERHHIIPKSLGGDNSKLNLVLLTAREHFIAHLLLVRMVQDSDVYKMINAIRRFTKKVTNASEFGLLRSTISKYSKGSLNPAFGKIWIHDVQTNEIFYVPKSDFESMPQDQFKKGLPYQRGGHRGTIWINNGMDETCIKPDRLQEFVSNGWIGGRINSAGRDHMKHMASKRHTLQKDLEHSQKLTGRIAVKHIKTGKVKKIHRCELLHYEGLGYTRNANFETALSYKVIIEGVVYDTLYDASLAYNIPKSTVSYRINSNIKKWKEWNKLDP